MRVIDSFLHFNVLVCSLILLQALDASAATIGQIVSLGVHSLSLFFTQIKRQLKEKKLNENHLLAACGVFVCWSN